MIPAWAASLVIGVVIAAIGAVLTLSGIKGLSVRRLIPERTARNIRPDAQLVREHI